MGNPLDTSHPFRASISHGQGQSFEPSASTSSSSASETPSKTEKKSSFNLDVLSPKAKLGLYALVGLIVTYGWIEVYDAVFPPTAKAEKTSSNYGTEANEDWAYQARRADPDARATSVSWFESTFCRGGRRAQFCR